MGKTTKMSFEYTIERKVKGTRTFFYPVKNGKRFNNINYARLYDAKELVKQMVKIHGAEKLNQIFA